MLRVASSAKAPPSGTVARVNYNLLFAALLGIASCAIGAGCAPSAGASCWDEGALQCTEKSKGVICSAHVWTPTSCAGPAGCAPVGTRAKCDDSRVDTAIACVREGQVSCSADAKARVQCKGNVWTVLDTCVASACVATREHVWCDTALRSAP